MKIQAFQTPISKAGINDMSHLLFKISLGQHIRCGLSVVLGDSIVNKHLVASSEEYHLTGQCNSITRL
jgi:hypothetical protein